MGGSLNKAMILGNLGSDPELRYTKSNTPVCNISVATNEVWTDSNGERQQRTEWHRVVVFGRTAENMNEYLEKGRQVFVEGRLQTREWEDKQGQTKYTTEIVADNVQFLSSRGQGDGRPQQGPPPAQQQPQGGGQQSPDVDADFEQSFDDDDIPF